MNNGSSTARSLAFLAAAIGMWATSAAQTATDACSYDAGNEYTVGTSCTFSAFNKPTAFVANLNPGGCNSGNYDDAFGWFTATSTTTILTYDPNDSHRPVMHVFTGACGSLTQVGCVDAGANDSNAELMLQTTVGTNYMIRIQRYNTSGAMNGRLCVWSPYSTNLCGFPDISQIPVGGTCDPRPFLKPTAYTAAMNPGGCNSGNYDDAFGWFTATGTHTVITYDPDASHRPIMHVFTGTCGSLTQVACVDAGANGSNAELVLPTVVGTSYLIRIQRYNTSDEMNGTICVWTPNTTDVCDFPAFSRIPVDFPCTPRPFENPAAYVPNYNPGGCNAGNYDDAYGWFTATSTTTIITYDPDGSQRPIMHVFTGTCGSLTQVACVDAGSNGANAVITLATTVGVNYLIRIQRYNTSDAMFGTICITRPPTNDNCATAIDLPVIDNCYVQYFSNTGATASGTSPNPSCGGTPSTDVWFRFVTPASGVVHISTTAGTLADGSMQIYSGTCGALALVANGCNNDGGVAPDNLMPRLDRRCTPLSGNTTYYIRFWGYNGAQGSFGICVYGPDIFPTPMQDCSGGFTVCGSGVITNTSDWTGCTADLKNTNRGCLLNNERQGTWYYFSPRSTGSVGFTIQPTDHLGQPAQIDYDFAVWGPMNAVTCPPSGAPLRCSYAYPPSAGTWLTGMAAGNSDLSEGASGGSVNGFVAPITVAVGDVGKVYTIYIDNFDVSGQTFNLSWALSAPNQLDCSVLPVEVIDLKAVAGPGSIAVEWTAQDIAATDLFLVERSADGMAFDVIGSLRANGTGSGTTRYLFHDEVPIQGVNYYRITSISADGQQAHTSVVNALFRPVAHTLLAMPNPAHTTLRILVDDKDLNGPATLLLMDGSGRLIATQRSEADAGTTDISISVADLDAGYYLFQLVDAWGGLVGTGRFVKE